MDYNKDSPTEIPLPGQHRAQSDHAVLATGVALVRELEAAMGEETAGPAGEVTLERDPYSREGTEGNCSHIACSARVDARRSGTCSPQDGDLSRPSRPNFLPSFFVEGRGRNG